MLRFSGRGQWKEGLAELREALRRDPDNAKVKAALARCIGASARRVRRQRQRKAAASRPAADKSEGSERVLEDDLHPEFDLPAADIT